MRQLGIAAAVFALTIVPAVSAQAPKVERTAKDAKQGAPSESMLKKRWYLGKDLELIDMSRAEVLAHPASHKELGVTKDQESRFLDLSSTFKRNADADRKRLDDAIAEYKKAQDANGAPYDPDVIKDLVKQRSARAMNSISELTEARNKVLLPSQKSRLSEIAIQTNGPMAFVDPEVQRQLKLDDDQIELISDIIQRGREEFLKSTALPRNLMTTEFLTAEGEQRREFLKSEIYKPEIAKSRASAARIRASITQKIVRFLGKQQRAAYIAMLGKPFDTSKIAMPATKDSIRSVESKATDSKSSKGKDTMPIEESKTKADELKKSK